MWPLEKILYFLFWKSSQFCTKSLICTKGGKILRLEQAINTNGEGWDVTRQQCWHLPVWRRSWHKYVLQWRAAVGSSRVLHLNFGKSHGVIIRQPYKQRQKAWRKHILNLSWIIQPCANGSLLLCWFYRKATSTVTFICLFHHVLSWIHLFVGLIRIHDFFKHHIHRDVLQSQDLCPCRRTVGMHRAKSWH